MYPMPPQETQANTIVSIDSVQNGMLAKGAAAHAMHKLPEDFVPGEHDVICGRGKKIFKHPGNERFRAMVNSCLQHYQQTETKTEKSFILAMIVSQVRSNSPNGGFVKKEDKDGRWYEVGDFLAREKTSQAFRDALHFQYKSSNKFKRMRRQVEQRNQFMQRRAFSSSALLSSQFGANSASQGSGLNGMQNATPRDFNIGGRQGVQSCNNINNNNNAYQVYAEPAMNNTNELHDDLDNFKWDVTTEDVYRDSSATSDALLGVFQNKSTSSRVTSEPMASSVLQNGSQRMTSSVLQNGSQRMTPRQLLALAQGNCSNNPFVVAQRGGPRSQAQFANMMSSYSLYK